MPVLRVGLTGGIGAGKSAVGELLDGPAFLIIDADRLGHEVLDHDADARDEIVAAFGGTVIDAAGHIDRARLGAEVFADNDARRKLEAILHPRIRLAEEARVQAWGVTAGVAVTEAALLVETGGHRRYQRLVVVDAPREVRLQRLARRGMPRDEARRRMDAQLPQAAKSALADYVIDNGGDHAHLVRQVEPLRDDLMTDLQDLDAGVSLRRREP